MSATSRLSLCVSQVFTTATLGNLRLITALNLRQICTARVLFFLSSRKSSANKGVHHGSLGSELSTFQRNDSRPMYVFQQKFMSAAFPPLSVISRMGGFQIQTSDFASAVHFSAHLAQRFAVGNSVLQHRACSSQHPASKSKLRQHRPAPCLARWLLRMGSDMDTCTSVVDAIDTRIGLVKTSLSAGPETVLPSTR